MALSTYAELQDHIAVTLDRDDVAGRVADFIAMAEARFNNIIRVGQMEASATVVLTSNVGPLPTDYLQWRRVRANSSPVRELQYAEPSWIAEHYPNTAADYASYFTIIGSNITTAPPSSSDLLLDYYQKIPALADSVTGTNWLLTRAPNVYVYGACLEASPWLDDDARIPMWGQFLERAIDELKSADVMARYSRPVARVRGVTP